jgi:chemotaxis signal transduction protein
MVPEEAIEATPEVAGGRDSAYIKGIAKLGEQLIILLDLDALFGAGDRAVMAAAA